MNRFDVSVPYLVMTGMGLAAKEGVEQACSAIKEQAQEVAHIVNDKATAVLSNTRAYMEPPIQSVKEKFKSSYTAAKDEMTHIPEKISSACQGAMHSSKTFLAKNSDVIAFSACVMGSAYSTPSLFITGFAAGIAARKKYSNLIDQAIENKYNVKVENLALKPSNPNERPVTSTELILIGAATGAAIISSVALAPIYTIGAMLTVGAVTGVWTARKIIAI